MKEMTLRQLEYFVAVAEEQSITKAALKCHVTQAGISLAIKDLESALGVDLAIRRKSKGVCLTPTGRVVANRARALLGEARHLVDSVDDVAGGFSGTFTVGCFSTLSTLVIPEVADYFAREHPDVKLEFVEGPGPEIQEMLLRGQIDLCFLYEVQRHPEVETVLLAERHFLVALSPEHPLAEREEVSIRELTPHPAALLDVEPASYLNESLLRRFGAEPNVAYRSASVHTIRELVGRGLAYSLLMQEVRESPEGRPLKFLPIMEPVGTNSLLVGHPRGIRPSRLATALIDYCRDHLPVG
ncbi:LysR family transcriptional regulator [Streptomyces sp. BH097]|uniref:LysR family transcriptional regulator n=1 Tax=unclassified Streptomyces TaxID=2593676 RepID=UPI003BB5FF1B